MVIDKEEKEHRGRNISNNGQTGLYTFFLTTNDFRSISP
jgi:hypothetical protein